MKKIAVGIISVGLCTALLATGIKTASNAFADEAGSEKIETVTLDVDSLEKNVGDVEADGTEQIGAIADNLLSSLLASESGTEAEGTAKEETVYVVADANGGAQKVIVSDWIKNVSKEDKLSDKTMLTDIVNVKGDETYEKNGNDCIWDAKGSDISYQGRIDKELPIDVKVSYILDGKEMTPEEIKGKSGHVVIRFEYENKAFEEVEIAGKKEKMNIPFLMLTGLVLDDDKFTNIKASNAKQINDGSRTIVVGIALPGLQDNLAIDREKLNIPESLEISADVTDFSLAMSVTVATNELFAKLSSVDINSLDSLSESMGELTDAMSQLTNGTEALSDGLATLLEKSGELETGIGQLAEGSSSLKDGIASADAGVGALADGAGKLADGSKALADGAGQLQSGAGQLSDGAGLVAGGVDQLKTGLDTLAANNDALMGGAEQVFNTILATAESQIKEAGVNVDLTIENYGETLDSIAAQIQLAISAYEQLDPDTAAVYKEKAAALAGLKATLDSYNTFYTGLASYTDGVAQAAAGSATLKTGTDSLKSGAEELKTGVDSLKTGADSLSAGAGELKNGIGTLKDGTGKLLDGAEALNGGLEQLKDNIPALKDGVTQLYDGSVLLRDGIKEFNDKGIQKITEMVEGELEGIIERIRVMGELAEGYNNFAGIGDGMKGTVKFIYRTEEIK